MSINVSQSFKRTSANAIDETLTLSKAEMLAVNDNLMPSKYLTVCQDDGLIYLYDKSNTVDSTTGKFRVFESGGGGHEIEDDSGTALTQRETMQFGDGFNVSDDSTNEKTVVEPNLMTSADMDDVVTPLPGTFARYHEYSTTEQVVGKWTNGKTIYERSFSYTVTDSITDGTVKNIYTDIVINDVDFITKIDCEMQTIDGSTIFPLDTYWYNANTHYFTRALISISNNTATLSLATNRTTTQGATLYATIQYTKTT